ncbi:MAG: Stp1/IreP family PP2C-type Ser/Thr phosphatase [Pseudomonadota bacterium]
MVARTDRGLVRGHNEDAVFHDLEQGLVILADGMGGYNAGEIASGMATSLLASELSLALKDTPPQLIELETGKPFAHRCFVNKIVQTNSAIYNAAQSQPQYAGMGTTLVAALFYNNRVTLAHVGDSRAYRLRDEVLTTITRDHSLLQEQIDSGMITPEEARYSQNRSLVTRAVGIDPDVDPEISDRTVLPGDIYLLCSDGLNDMVPDEDIQLTLNTLSANLELAAMQLIQLANDNGGRDNISVILVKVLHEFPATKGWWAKLISCLK